MRTLWEDLPVTMPEDLLPWLRQQCGDFRFDVRGIFRRDSSDSRWPVAAANPEQLEEVLTAGGHLLPLPKEPAALANIFEVAIVDHLLDRLGGEGAGGMRGSERGYPDLEISGTRFGGGFHAVDVKVARRAQTRGRPRTQSRITLYTGNTYFKWPDLHWPGTFRAFNDYVSHLDVIVIYTLLSDSPSRVADLELIVQEPWRIASRKRSSTTREYIGAVDGLDDLRSGKGEFETAEEFYRYWRRFPFRISAQVQRQLDRLVQQQREELERLRNEQP